MRCPSCGARVGDSDRACFSCHAVLTRRSPAPEAPSALHEVTAAPALPTQPVAVAVTQIAEPVAGPAAAPTSAPLRLEWVWGKERQTVELTDRAVMIGSAPTADLRIKASFLLAEHAIIEPDGAGAWQVRVLAPGASVVRQGVVAAQAPLLPGDVLRLTDRIGNFITLRALGEVLRVRDQALRSLLPQPGESYLIGSDPSCATRLDHPLVHRRHAALRRDGAGTLWVEDRGTSAGTYVNGHRLRGKQRLALSDIVQIGPFTATVGPHALEPLAQVSGVDIQVQRATVTAGPKTLLHGVDLHLPPATLTAIVGPSGAGKTTLMRLLSGQSAASSGQVTYNGVPIAECREGYAELTGFVPQDDLVHADLTVDEGLLYQARLRLGASTSEEERRARVDKLVGMLGLATQRGQLVKTLSGGQRKRVCIACELLKEPELLFLDEPTSGLDPGLDKRMMLLLRLLADQGRTVLLTTHSIAHVDVCDTLVLVGPGGYVIYAGPPSAAAEMFGVDTLGEVFAIIDSPEAALEASLRRTPTAAPAPVMPRRVAPTPSASGAGPAFGSAAWWRSLGPEMRIFTSRHLRLIVRDRSATAFTLLQGIVVALLTAAVAPSPLIWKDNSNSMMFVLGCAAVWFGMITSVRELVKERGIWRREFAAGANLYAYLASKLVVLGGLAVVQSLSMTVALGAVVGLPPDAPFGGAFIPIVISLTAANMAGVTMGLLVSATSRTADRALSLVPYLLVGQLILCGVLFRLGSLTFVSWLTPARWAVSSLGGIAGLDAKALHQAGGLYPHSAAGLFANWVVLVLTSLAAVAATCFAMQRQGRAWNAGLEMPEPLWRSMTTGSGSRV